MGLSAGSLGLYPFLLGDPHGRTLRSVQARWEQAVFHSSAVNLNPGKRGGLPIPLCRSGLGDGIDLALRDPGFAEDSEVASAKAFHDAYSETGRYGTWLGQSHDLGGTDAGLVVVVQVAASVEAGPQWPGELTH